MITDEDPRGSPAEAEEDALLRRIAASWDVQEEDNLVVLMTDVERWLLGREDAVRVLPLDCTRMIQLYI